MSLAEGRRQAIEQQGTVRRLHAQVTIMVLGGATLLDDGPFLVVAAVTAATALVLCGVRRLMAAANGFGRGGVPMDMGRPEMAQPSPGSACGTDPGLAGSE